MSGRDPRVKTIEQIKAEAVGKTFAKERKLSMDDPIVRRLIRDVKVTFGRIRARNRKEADMRSIQPDLFRRAEDQP